MKREVVPNEAIERELRGRGHEMIVGLDEVGRGAWAGPLVVGAVILPPNRRILGLRDSKLLRPEQREKLAARIKEVAMAWAIGVVEVAELNEIGLTESLGLAAHRAIDNLGNLDTFPLPPDRWQWEGVQTLPVISRLLIDGKSPYRGLTQPQQPIIRGDQTVRVIAAASVIAKVARDAMLRALHETDPAVRQFRFDLNKGYPSPLHRTALRIHGPTIHHRARFAPIAELLAVTGFAD